MIYLSQVTYFFDIIIFFCTHKYFMIKLHSMKYKFIIIYIKIMCTKENNYIEKILLIVTSKLCF